MRTRWAGTDAITQRTPSRHDRPHCRFSVTARPDPRRRSGYTAPRLGGCAWTLPLRSGTGLASVRGSDGDNSTVMNFENDIFISYAHIDDQPLVEGQKGWISSFHRALEIRLAQLLGREPRIWRDPKLQGNDIFADRLVECLPGVGAPRLDRVPPLRPVGVVHPRAEGVRQGHLEHGRGAAGRQGEGLQDRQDPRSARPAARGVPGAVWATTSTSWIQRRDAPGKLSQTGDPESQRLYWVKLDDLAHDIAECLESLEPGASNGAEVGGGTAAHFGLPRRDELRPARGAGRHQAGAPGPRPHRASRPSPPPGGSGMRGCRPGAARPLPPLDPPRREELRADSGRGQRVDRRHAERAGHRAGRVRGVLPPHLAAPGPRQRRREAAPVHRAAPDRRAHPGRGGHAPDLARGLQERGPAANAPAGGERRTPLPRRRLPRGTRKTPSDESTSSTTSATVTAPPPSRTTSSSRASR